MSGDKVTGFSTIYKRDNNFTRNLALMALSDAKHDFKGPTYTAEIEDILKRGLPHEFTVADRALKAVEEGKVIEAMFGLPQVDFFENIRNSREPYNVMMMLGSSMVHTHYARGLQLYDEDDNYITSYTGSSLVDYFGIDNANLIVDLDSIGFMTALKTGPHDYSKTVKYLLISEGFNDPATRQGIDSDVFKMTEGVKLISLLQHGGLSFKYNAWNPAAQTHTNDLFSKYNFELSPVLEPKKDKFNITTTITNPAGKKIFIDNPKKNNAITAIKKKLEDIVTKLFSRGPTEEGIFQRNVKYQQKRSGDWLQALAVQDIINRNFVDINRNPVHISGESYLVTHDRIALTYGLLTGSNAIFVHNWKGHGRFVYVFKKVKPVPVIGIAPEPVSREAIILQYYKEGEGKRLYENLLSSLQTQYSEFSEMLASSYEGDIPHLCEILIGPTLGDDTSPPSFKTIKEIINKLAEYIYVCGAVPHYSELIENLTIYYNHIISIDRIDSEEKSNSINNFNSMFNRLRILLDTTYTSFINLADFKTSESYRSINELRAATPIEDYKGFFYITNNSFNGYKIYELRNYVTLRFEKLLRLPYFDILNETSLFYERLLLLGIVQLSTERPDPKMIQTFNERVKNDPLLKESALLNFTSTETEVADILINFSEGYDYLMSFHLQNDPIYRMSLRGNEVVNVFYGTTVGGSRGSHTMTSIKSGRATRKTGQYMQTTATGSVMFGPGWTGFSPHGKTFKQLMKTTRKPTTVGTRMFSPGWTGFFSSGHPVGQTTMTRKASYSASALSEPLQNITFYGHHPFTPLLYLQLRVISYIQEHDEEAPDYSLYLLLGKILNVLIKSLKTVLNFGVDSNTVLAGLILKYLLYIAIPKQKHLGVLFKGKAAKRKYELAILLSSLVYDINLFYTSTQETAFSELLKRRNIETFIRTIRDEIGKITVNTSKVNSYIDKTIKNIKYIHSAIKYIDDNIFVVAQAPTRKRTPFIQQRVRVGTKRKRNSESNRATRRVKRRSLNTVNEENNANENL